MSELRRVQKELHQNAAEKSGNGWREPAIAQDAWAYRVQVIDGADDFELWRVAIWKSKQRHLLYNVSRLLVYQVAGGWTEDVDQLIGSVPKPGFEFSRYESLFVQENFSNDSQLAVWQGDGDQFRPFPAARARELFPAHESTEDFALEAMYAGLSGAYPLRVPTTPLPVPSFPRLNI